MVPVSFLADRGCHPDLLKHCTDTMSPSISAIERNNPPPRRKSCSACIKAKRRCTQETPACQRCAQRSLVCQYPEGRASKRPLLARTPSTPSHSLTGPPSALPTPGSSWDFSGWENPSVHLESQEQDDPHFILLDGVDPLDLFSFDDLDPVLEGPNLAANDPVQVPQGMPPQPPNFDTGTTRIINDLVIPGPPACLPQTAAVAWAFKNRLNFALEKIRDAPRQMVCENQTPWSHPCLYEHSMPQSMQEEAAFALMSHITFEEGTFDLPSDRPDQPQPLQSTIKSDEQILPLHPLSTTRQFWETWVFQESARRTFLIVFFFVQIYRLLKGDVPTKCDGKLGMNSSFTLGEGVWKARGPLTFGIAWGEGRRWAVRNANFSAALGKARAEDVDVFSKMVLSSFWGIDETKGWLMSTGGDL
ncbi:hypothetical protein B0T21DRAFT_358710 [Apiosordaria backusii]|uniref:Zn(2)-C6 fungal-type domain-containing protein n=1 Tax=Apiosordaria backusii TaxID=314023 RepID=A0AA40K3U8_9PEZI|nr:hypothetical protein B0T21DRAFT_358710 [Apiosordaria backusii]